ncbi:MAG TPA: sugar transferase [Pseudonocardia sp.]|uniref:sugar transferase n=1 Tax=Pseudonocardia sp. TaxID=60912 RepID=UPI002B4B72C2|nr:sugar transferase [Pseudonocardia sp.]HLU59354.1 sugar transferase [Pseudonocardia sp.]
MRRVLLVGWDAVGWAIALTLALGLRYEFDLDADDASGIALLIAVAVVTQILIGVALQVYRGRHCIGSVDNIVDTAASIALTGFVVFVANVVSVAEWIPRSVAIIGTPIMLLIAVGSRVAVGQHRARKARPDHSAAQRVIIYGAGVEGQQLSWSMLTDPDARYLPVAFLDDDPQRRGLRVSGVGVHGTSADLADVAARTGADLLAITGRSTDGAAIGELSRAAAAAGLEVRVVAPLAELLRPVPPTLLIPTQAGSAPNGGRAPVSRPPAALESRAKRFVDVALSLVALVVFLPFFVVVPAVLLATSGEVIYRAKRVGLGGEIFTMFKFTTMAPGDGGPRLTRAGDPRITPFGRWLRSTKLNELPQLVNVLKGEMSLVGPRPEDPRYAAFYTAEQRKVLSVRPGLVSLAFLRFGDEEAYIERVDPDDIEAFYLNELLPEKLAIELGYVENWSLRDDFRILARTAKGLLT